MSRLINKNIITVIPARMGSSRFPGKPMATILGVPMIERVWTNCSQSSIVKRNVVATCDQEIFDHISSIGGEAVMTSANHERASDRTAEAVDIIEKKYSINFEIVVMVQGDEPLVKPGMIDEALQPFEDDDDIVVTNLSGSISKEECSNSDTIKVVTDCNGFALYLSRSPIPAYVEQLDSACCGKQVCIIPFKRDFLKVYGDLPQTPLEKSESIDMLRVLEHGFKLKMVRTQWLSHPVDTPEDLEIVESILRAES